MNEHEWVDKGAVGVVEGVECQQTRGEGEGEARRG